MGRANIALPFAPTAAMSWPSGRDASGITRRIGRPKSSAQAAKLVDQAAAFATQLKRRKRTGPDAKPSRSRDTLTRRSEMNDTRRKGTKERSASTRGKIAKPQRPQDEKKKTESEREQDKIMTPEKQGGIAGP